MMFLDGIKFIKKQFKLEDSLFSFQEVYSIYISKETGEWEKKESDFLLLDLTIQDFYLEIFKKVPGGKVDKKVFIEQFVKDTNQNSSIQLLLQKMFNRQIGFEDACNQITKKIVKEIFIETDIVVNFLKVNMPISNEEVPIIFCSINKVMPGKTELVFDKKNKDFEAKNPFDWVVKVTSPLHGFMYPIITVSGAEFAKTDANYILQYSAKNQIGFGSKVLGCNVKLSIDQEKEVFDEILNSLLGEKVAASRLQMFYEDILQKFEKEKDEEHRVIMQDILRKSLEGVGFDLKMTIKEAYGEHLTMLENPVYDFKVDNVIPSPYTQSVMLYNDSTQIFLKPAHLNEVEQMQNENGEMFIKIPLNQNLKINGMNII